MELWAISPIKIRKKYPYTEQIPRKQIIVLFGSITRGEQHTKSLPKSDPHKGPNYDVIIVHQPAMLALPPWQNQINFRRCVSTYIMLV